MNARFIALCSIVLGLALYRILPHPVNFTPVMAMALFSGAHFDDRRLAFLLPMSAMLLSDLVIGLHSTMLFVYLGLALTVLFGIWIGNARLTVALLSATAASAMFFLISNLGAWLYSPGLYSRDWPGLLTAYIAAIPFYQNSLLSDLVFTAMLFGGWRVAERIFPQLVLYRALP